MAGASRPALSVPAIQHMPTTTSDPGTGGSCMATPPRFWLAEHVRACRVGDQVILLDLRRNRYLGVASRAAEAPGSWVDGWPPTTDGAEIATILGPSETTCQSLLAQGLLSIRPARRAGVAPPAAPLDTLDADDLVPMARVGTLRLLRCLRSAALASIWLRSRTLQQIESSLAHRRASASIDGGAARALRESVAAYLTLRPLLATAQDRCLHDSLALVLFLGGERLAAHCVIGVRTRPFAAHAWAQSGNLVLNDAHETAHRYKPILVA
jgi:Transglutaminase-like superfamily